MIAALFLVVPAYSAAAPVATEEYVLTLPGVDRSRIGAPEPDIGPQAPEDSGVLAETESPTALAALGQAAATPAGIATVLGGLLIAGLVVVRRGREQS